MSRDRSVYCHHRVVCSSRRWREAAGRIVDGCDRLDREGGTLYGIWRSQIGRPRDELTAITVWDESVSAARAPSASFEGIEDVTGHEMILMEPTLRPDTPASPRRQGNYAFRWFSLPSANWPEFLDLCAAAWPGFESAYDSQVIGLWRAVGTGDHVCRALLLTRRPSLAMWERSKLPEGEAEAEVRRKLSRRYDLCDSTEVCTTTLLTASDREDTARWT